jgi:hypothetical protein
VDLQSSRTEGDQSSLVSDLEEHDCGGSPHTYEHAPGNAVISRSGFFQFDVHGADLHPRGNGYLSGLIKAVPFEAKVCEVPDGRIFHKKTSGLDSPARKSPRNAGVYRLIMEGKTRAIHETNH